ncbi:hypothetical protein [Dictyobacter formicarum]|uniref:Uncharacterized protein n=1 Tax=Dictyobacter formicarum TaxID=2778368 RepID=A0ABQ3VGP0_9CHLR|nr:hypothetical protein [Dictyobacter formicarum]GHO84945.1 hypothetical protein KSZ_29510 [Dictyobacter formicarum]
MALLEDTPLERQEEGRSTSKMVLSSRSIARRAFFTKSLTIGASVIGLHLLDGHLHDAAAATATRQPSRTTNKDKALRTTRLQACGRATDGRLYHTIRFPSGSWQSSFGIINDQESNGRFLRFIDVDCAGIVDSLHVTALERSGIIWHTIRFPNGTWEGAFGNVNDQESNGSALRFTNVSCAGTASNTLHVTALTRFGAIWHTIRFSNGSWQSSFGNVNDQESNGNALSFTDVDCATIGENLHVCAIDRNGILWHTIRFANGTWQSFFGNVNDQESNGKTLRFTSVGCASIGGDLHVTATDRNGVLWHTIRFSNGTWQSSFGNVNDQERNGRTLRFTDVDCANVADTLHVTAIDKGNVLWHTIRFSNGTWTPYFGNVNDQENNGKTLRFTDVGAAGAV